MYVYMDLSIINQLQVYYINHKPYSSCSYHGEPSISVKESHCERVIGDDSW